MPTGTSEKIRSGLERLDAEVAEAEAIRRRHLERGAAIVEALRGMRQSLQEALRAGVERGALLADLAAVRPAVERAADWFRRVQPSWEYDAEAAGVIEPQFREAEDFLTWLRELEGRASAPVPPFDPSRLPAAPDGAVAAGYVSVSEARARARAKKS
jgi:hypothetical protein